MFDWLMQGFFSYIFICYSTNVQVKIWDPSLRGSELKATLKGHTGSLLFRFAFITVLSSFLVSNHLSHLFSANV